MQRIVITTDDQPIKLVIRRPKTKSQVVAQVAKKLGLKVKRFRLAKANGIDLRGLPWR